MRVLVKLSQEELEKLGEIMGNEIEEAEDAAYAIHELIASAEQIGKDMRYADIRIVNNPV